MAVHTRSSFRILAPALIAVGLLYSSSAEAYVRRRVTRDGGAVALFWSAARRPVSFVINSDRRPEGVSRSAFEGAVRRAFRAWQEVADSELTFVEDLDPRSQSRVDFEADDVHLVMLDLDNSSGLFTDASEVAVTSLEVGQDGEIIDADIILNGRDFAFSTTLEEGSLDLQATLTREVGRFLGLDHTLVLGATMSPRMQLASSLKRALAPDDRAGVAAIYPRVNNATGGLAGRILRAGEGVEGAKVVALLARNGRILASTITDANGDWILEELPSAEDVQVFVEPLTGPIVPADIPSLELLDVALDFRAEVYGGFPLAASFFPGNGAPNFIGELEVRNPSLFGAVEAQNVNGSAGIRQGESGRLSFEFEGLISASDSIVSSSPDINIADVVVTNDGTSRVSFEASVGPDTEPGEYVVFIRRVLDDSLTVVTGAIQVLGPPPIVLGADPLVVPFGSTLSILGENFEPNARVSLNGTLISATAVISSQEIAVTLPREGADDAIEEGPQDIEVENPDGQIGSLTSAFTATDDETTGGGGAPVASEMSPAGAGQGGAPPFGGSGGGGGGCDLARGENPGPLSSLATFLLLLALLALRRCRRALASQKGPAMTANRRSLSARLGLAALVLSLGLAGVAHAYTRIQTSSGGGVNELFWPQQSMALSYVISYANLPGNVSQSDLDGAVRRSFQVWQDNPDSSVAFFEDGNPANKLRADTSAQDSHLVVFDPDNDSGFFGQSGIVAVSPIAFFASGEIIDADIILNDRDFDFSADQSSGTFDIQNIVTHEVGHFIGLDHSGVFGATMFPFARTRELRARSLDPDDRAGAAAIYPVNGSPTGALRGRVVRGGAPVPGAQVVAYDSLSGAVAASTLSDDEGGWVLRELPSARDYFVYAEPLDGPMTSANSGAVNPGAFDTDFGATYYSGFPPSVAFTVTADGSEDLGALEVRPIAAGGAMNITNTSSPTVDLGQTVRVILSAENLLSTDQVSSSSPDLVVSGLISGNSVTATITAPPTAVLGAFNLVVLRDASDDVAVLTAGIEVRTPAPSIDAIDPASADAEARETVTINGQNFREDLVVLMKGEVMKDVAVISDTQINVTLPLLVAGAKDVSVENGDGRFALMRDAFTATGEGVPPPPPPQDPLPPSAPQPATFNLPPAPGGGGGGGGGCDLARGQPADPLAILPCALLLLILVVLRRRS